MAKNGLLKKKLQDPKTFPLPASIFSVQKIIARPYTLEKWLRDPTSKRGNIMALSDVYANNLLPETAHTLPKPRLSSLLSSIGVVTNVVDHGVPTIHVSVEVLKSSVISKNKWLSPVTSSLLILVDNTATFRLFPASTHHVAGFSVGYCNGRGWLGGSTSIFYQQFGIILTPVEVDLGPYHNLLACISAKHE